LFYFISESEHLIILGAAIYRTVISRWVAQTLFENTERSIRETILSAWACDKYQ